MSPSEQTPGPSKNIASSLDELEKAALVEELESFNKLTPEELAAELKAAGFDADRSDALMKEVMAENQLLNSPGSLERLASLSADDLDSEITKAGLDPKRVGVHVRAALAKWRAKR